MSHPALLDFAPLKRAFFALYAEILAGNAADFPHMVGMSREASLRDLTRWMPFCRIWNPR